MRGWLGRAGQSAARVLAMAVAVVALVSAAPAAAQVGCQLCATKSFSPASVPSGGTSTMSIHLVNTSKVDPFDLITFSDTFPPGMTLVSAGANQCSGTLTPTGTSGFTFANGSLNAGQACTITAVVSASGPAGHAGQLDFEFHLLRGRLYGHGAGGERNAQDHRRTAADDHQRAAAERSRRRRLRFQVTVNGSPPITVSASGLPTGLSLDPSTRLITGTPNQVGTFSGTITATNGIKPNDVQPFTIVIGVPPLQITTPPTVFATPISAGAPLDLTLQAVGGVPPYAWDLAGGNLPPGVTLGGNGHLIGTATAAGTYDFTAGVTDSLGTRTTQAYRITVAKADGQLVVTTAPSPVISGQTMTVTATLVGAVPATGTVEVWVAGSATSCPARFKFGNPGNPVAPVRTAPMDSAGKARVAMAGLPIDDYGVCVHYSGDALYNEAFAGPSDVFVIKGVLLPAPAVALAAPTQARARSTVGIDVTVTPVGTTLVPGGAVEIRRDGQAVATVELQDGVAHAMVAGPVDASVEVSAVYMGDGTFPPVASPAYLILLDLSPDLTIPTLSETLLALLALLLGIFGARRLRR